MSTKSPGRILTVKTKITNNTLRKHLAESMREKHKRQIIRDTELARILHENAEFWGDFSESICSIGRKA